MKVRPSGRVVVIGAGMVGSSIAYSILNQELATSLLLIDIAEELAKAHVLDMRDATQFTRGTNIEFANYTDIVDGDVVVVTSGVAQKDGQSRTDLLKVNADIVKSVVKSIKATRKKVYLIMVTNPVDVMTYVAVRESGLPESMVFGSGTYLDTGRLRLAIAEQLDINHNNIHAYIMGEHGDTSFPLLSNANVSGMDLTNLMDVNKDLYVELMEQVRNKAYEIIKGKKSTYFGIGNAVAALVRAIIRNEKRMMSVTVPLDGEYGFKDLCIGVPVKISANGWEFIGEVELNGQEQKLFAKSAAQIKKNIRTLFS